MGKTSEAARTKNWNRIIVLFVIGVLAFVVGLILQWYPPYVINGLYDSLKQPNLKIETIWMVGGALDWWNNSYINLFLPLSTVLFVISIAMFVCVTIYLWSRLVNKKLS